jgi:hypothetical protein
VVAGGSITRSRKCDHGVDWDIVRQRGRVKQQLKLFCRREVNFEDGRQWQHEHGVNLFFETSSKENINIVQVVVLEGLGYLRHLRELQNLCSLSTATS